MKKAALIGTSIMVFASPLVAMAQSPGRIVPCDGIKCNLCHVADLIQNVLNFGVYIAVVGSALLIAYAGLLYLSSGGNPTKHGQATKIFTSVAIGLVIIIASWMLIDTIMKTLIPNGNINGWGPWNQICPGSSVGLIIEQDRV